MTHRQMTRLELKNTALLAAIFACRMLGLFMVLPVLGLYLDVIPGATPFTLGLAAGIYGFTQAVCQLPFGALSDKLGRKPIIFVGLLIFILGSLIAAFSHSIGGLIIGRAIQGAGAIGAPVLAFIADLTRTSVRTRAMAGIGVSIGCTFMVAFLVGPRLEAALGLHSLFVITAALGVMGIGLLYCVTPEAVLVKPHPNAKSGGIYTLVRNSPYLVRLNINIFVLHAVLTACFLVIPHQIQNIAGLVTGDSWQYYLPVLLLSVLCIAPWLRKTENISVQIKHMKAAWLAIGCGIISLFSATGVGFLFGGGILFFAAFNLLESILPALISRVAPLHSKGLAMGLYSCSQFLGMFVGGLLGGSLWQFFGPWGVGGGCLLLTIWAWLTLMNQRSNEQWLEA